MKTSSYEDKVIRILKAANVSFVREKTFSDLRGGLYRFDFYLPRFNTVIEVNGRQHYEFAPHFYKQRRDFLTAQLRDRRKISYCLAHKIQIFCVPFWEIDQIEDFYDLTRSEFRATTKYHNDNVWRVKQKETK